jgi:two-component system sensor histidine kinase RpfC
MPRRIVGWFETVARRFWDREDTEHEQALVRVVIGVLATGYVAIASAGDASLDRHELVTLTLGIAFLLFAVGNCVAIAIHPKPAPVRRVLSIVVDITITSAGMHVHGPRGAPFFVFFLWVVFGYGFRFGVRYLVIAATLSAVGFLAVAATTPYWRDQPYLSVGFIFPLLVLPLYVASLLRKLNDARTRAEEASNAKSQFLANMSHEVRTPVNGILGSLDLLARSPLSSGDLDLVRTMRLSADSLLSLLNSVLDFARFDAGAAVGQQEEFDLHAVVREVIALFRPAADAKALRLWVTLSPELPYALRGDAMRLRQVLGNLLGNAVKFTERGGVRLEAVAAGFGEETVEALFTVRDSGIGIAPEALERIFHPFSQADESVTRRYGGAGLGLAIASEAVALMGGELTVESEVGKGSVFRFRVPFRVRQLSLWEPPSDLGPATGRREGVLIVAPNRRLCEPVRQWLVDWGFRPSVVQTRQQAQARLMAREHAAGLGLVIVFSDGLSDAHEAVFTGVVDPSMSRIPQLLVGEVPGQDLSAYAAVLPPSPPKPQLFNAIHLAFSEPQERSAGSNLVPFPAPAARAPARGPRLRVLVADDNAVNRKIAGRILEAAGHLVRLAETGEAALDALESQDFDVAVLDVHMPGMSGIDVARVYGFTASGHGARVPLVALTANVLPETQRGCLEAGFRAFATKPIHADELVRVVEDLGRSRPGPELRSGTEEEGTKDSAHREPRQDGSALFDEQRVRELAEIDPGGDFLREVWRGFELDGERALHGIEAAIQDRDRGRLRREVQALAASAETIGAIPLSRACRRLLVEDGEPDERAAARSVRQEFGRTRAAKDLFLGLKALGT